MAYGDSPDTIAAKDQRAMRWMKFTLKALAGGVIFICLVIVVMGAITPQLNLYRANTEKKSAIAEARARSDAAEYEAERAIEIAGAEAEADRIRAEGIADANATIAESLTPAYTQWYFVDRLDDIDGQIIYVPTEAGVPVTEAGRAVDEDPER
jgi:type II secretory pathway component PulM